MSMQGAKRSACCCLKGAVYDLNISDVIACTVDTCVTRVTILSSESITSATAAGRGCDEDCSDAN